MLTGKASNEPNISRNIYAAIKHADISFSHFNQLLNSSKLTSFLCESLYSFVSSFLDVLSHLNISSFFLYSISIRL